MSPKLRVALVGLLSIAAATLPGGASAAAKVICSATFTLGGEQYIVIGKNTACTEAMPIARALVAAPTTRYVMRGSVRIAVLLPPRAGWTCASSTPIRSKGAGCRRGSQSVIYVKLT